MTKKAKQFILKNGRIIATAYKFGDNISTDLIISGRYKFAIRNMKELAKHAMEDADPQFYQNIKHRPTFIVAGWNFGMGSSREQAPLAIKEAEVKAVIAKNFARIFHRNAFNIGLPLIECNTDLIAHGDLLELDLVKGRLVNKTKKMQLAIQPLQPILKKLLKAGGLVNYLKKHKGLSFGT